MTPRRLFSIGIKLLIIGLISLLLSLIIVYCSHNSEFRWESRKQTIYNNDVVIEAGKIKTFQFQFYWEPPSDRLVKDDKISGTIKNMTLGSFRALLFSSFEAYCNWMEGYPYPYPYSFHEPIDTYYGTSCKFTADVNDVILVENPSPHNITIRFTAKAEWIQETDWILIVDFFYKVTAFLGIISLLSGFLLIIIAPIWKYVSSEKGTNAPNERQENPTLKLNQK